MLPPDTSDLRSIDARASRLGQPIIALAKAKWLNPELGAALARIKPHAGIPRAEVTVPVAPGDTLVDTMLFEAADDPQRKFYLPRYALASHRTDQGMQFRVRMTRQDPGARISVVVQPSMPSEVAAIAPDATALDHELVGEFTFEMPGTGMQRVVAFTDRRMLPDGVELSAVLPTMTDRDALYGALTTAAANGTFVVRRTMTVAIPTATVQTAPGERPRFTIKAPQRAIPQSVSIPRSPTATVLATMRMAKPALPQMRAARRLRPDILIAGPAIRDHRTRGVADIGAIAEITEITTDPAVPEAPATLYRVATRSLDHVQTPHPFVFSKDLHGYVYGDITGSSTLGGLVLEQLAFDGRHHSYYYAASRPEVIYYLPDAFKLARTPESPHAPMLSVAFDSADGHPASTSATVTFAASAVVSHARLLAAATVLAERSGIAVEAMDLQPFLADASRLALRVTLPGAAGVSAVLEGARIDLRSALSAGFQLPLDTFRAMFDRLNGASPRLFDGEVEVRLDRPDRAAEKVPLSVDMADLAGPLVEIVCARAGDADQVTIRNVIESPLRLDAVIAELPHDSGLLPCALQPPLSGTTLAPGQSVTAGIVSSHAHADQSAPALVRIAEATVIPDAAAIWDAVCDDNTSYVTREIVVKAPAQLFASASADNPILAIVVEVGGRTGGLTHTVELSAEHPSATATVNTPITDLVLHASDSGEYRYRVFTVRADRVTEGDWRQR